MVRVLRKLANPQFIKVAADATFKELFGSWCVAHVGVLSKRYGETFIDSDGKVKAPSWATHFSPVLHIMASSEHSAALEMGFQAFARLPTNTAGAPAGECVKQVHQDWSHAQERARIAEFPGSIAHKDYAHMIRNVCDCMPAKLIQKDASGQSIHLQDILKALRVSRTHCTTLCEFHHFWHAQLGAMKSQWKEGAAAKYLKETYFFTLPKDVAR